MFTETDTQMNMGQAQSSATTIRSKSFNLDKAIARAQAHLLDLQTPDGYWLFELEADCTIPSEYILMMHYLGDIDLELQKKIANYLRAHQSADGSYPLFSGGEGDLSCSVKVYYALKMVGDDINAPHMVKLRDYILSQAARQKRMCLPVLRWQFLNNYPGAVCLLFQWKLCCSQNGFRSI